MTEFMMTSPIPSSLALPNSLMDTKNEKSTRFPLDVEADVPKPVSNDAFADRRKTVLRLIAIVYVLVAYVVFFGGFKDDVDNVHDCHSVAASADFNITYLSVPGFFKQDRFGANETKIGPAPARFGLIDHSGKYWTKFVHTVDKLNEKAGPHVAYKVLYLARHGEGFHNVGMDYYGEDEWDKKWGRLNGNGTMTWGPDAQLTVNGIQQAVKIHELWVKEMDSGGGVPLPTKLFVSPMARALNTFQITYAGVVNKPPPIIVEGLRDTYGLRTADQRHNKTWIHQTYPAYKFEDGFTEADELWTKDERESDDHVQERVQKVLDKLFKLKDTYLGIVAHSNIVEATFKLLKHHDFDVPTGGVVPVLVKVMTNQL